LNAPWGMAVAPAGFGRFSNRLLVGNFGDGTIQAFDLASGRRVGSLRTAQGKRLVIPVLWGMSFGNGILNQPTDVLFFAAGPNFGTGGLYGRISPTSAETTSNDETDD
ncbi:MAG: TIGR03118 family protein, partial [Steroidobacteraceae bacterium]